MLIFFQNPARARWLTLAFAVLIGLATLLPAQQLPLAPGTDKLHHILAFAILVLPMSHARPRSVVKYMFLAFVFGALIEIIQPFVNRHSEMADLMADSIGIVLGAALGTLGRNFKAC